ncbi:hypothetical protein Aduo_018887 [Ancylostoma duodenale]
MRRRGMMSPILPTPLPIIQTTTGATQMREPPTIPTRRKYIRPYHPMVWPPPRHAEAPETSTVTSATSRRRRVIATTTATTSNFPST